MSVSLDSHRADVLGDLGPYEQEKVDRQQDAKHEPQDVHDAVGTPAGRRRIPSVLPSDTAVHPRADNAGFGRGHEAGRPNTHQNNSRGFRVATARPWWDLSAAQCPPPSPFNP